MKHKKDDSSTLLILAAAGFGLYWILSKNKKQPLGLDAAVAPTPVVAIPKTTQPVNEVVEQQIEPDVMPLTGSDIIYSNQVTGGGGSGQTAHAPAVDTYIMVEKQEDTLDQMAGFKKTRKKRS